MMRAPLDDYALDLLFRSARSFKRFHDDPIHEDQLRRIGELVKLGPTSLNQQPGRFVWCVSSEARARLAACATGANATKIAGAPVTVIVAEDHAFPDALEDISPKSAARLRERFAGDPEALARSAFMNTALQAGYLIMAVRAVGLDAGPMTGFVRERVDREFLSAWPMRRSLILVSLGRGDSTDLPERPVRVAFERFNSIV